MSTQFFLGANSPRGFASYYGDWLDLHNTRRLYIIKGTPGNGKSGFMRRIGKAMHADGLETEEIPCSGDPASLDGLYIPALKTAFVDGTAPHVTEPEFPVAVDTYLPLMQFVDDRAVQARKPDIIRLQGTLRDRYARLYRLLGAVKNLQDEQFALALTTEALDKIRFRSRGIIRREISRGSGGVLHKRFLSALSPEGECVLWDSVEELADRVFELWDNYRQAHYMLSLILAEALDAGQPVYACYDPMDPYQQLSHLILPELRLAFVSTNATRTLPFKPYRRIRLDACINPQHMRDIRLRMRFLKKTERALLQDASDIMADVKASHDRLEDIYVPHVDFFSLRALADAYAEKIKLDA